MFEIDRAVLDNPEACRQTIRGLLQQELPLSDEELENQTDSMIDYLGTVGEKRAELEELGLHIELLATDNGPVH